MRRGIFLLQILRPIFLGNLTRASAKDKLQKKFLQTGGNLMKKFFAVFAFVLTVALFSFAPQASADIYIDFSQVEFFPTEHKVLFHAKMGNTINKPVLVKKFDVRSISIYDADGNLIWSNAATFDNLNVSIPAYGEIEIPTDYDTRSTQRARIRRQNFYGRRHVDRVGNCRVIKKFLSPREKFLRGLFLIRN